MRINRANREISLKVVFYGPGMGGKTTNLLRLHGSYASHQRGDLVRLDTETERTLFFDYFPLEFGTIGGHKIRFDFFTVPGQSFYQNTRQAVLEGVDGLVFVADSSPDREDANLVSHDDMVQMLEARGREFLRVPCVYQWNKRDVKGAIPVSVLERTLNQRRAPSFEAIATAGDGVWETQSAIVRIVVEALRAGNSRTATTPGAAFG